MAANIASTKPTSLLDDDGRKRRTPLGDTVRTMRRKPLAILGLAIIVFWLLLGLLAPVLPVGDPKAQDLKQRMKPPSSEHVLGTDELGREVLARVVYGARISLPAGILVVIAAGAVGCLLGAMAGYLGGFLDAVVMRSSDAILAFPSIILAMTITAVRGGAGLENALIGVAFVLWPEYARLMRGQVLSIKANDYVSAAESLGASRWRILLRHILPSTDAPVIVKGTLDVGSVIVLTAGLSFIGLGALPTEAEWGLMIQQGSSKGFQYWWYAGFPGLAMVSVVMALNFFGDGLRDALDPKRRGR